MYKYYENSAPLIVSLIPLLLILKYTNKECDLQIEVTNLKIIFKATDYELIYKFLLLH
jgi:hypothetical protein